MPGYLSEQCGLVFSGLGFSSGAPRKKKTLSTIESYHSVTSPDSGFLGRPSQDVSYHADSVFVLYVIVRMIGSNDMFFVAGFYSRL